MNSLSSCLSFFINFYLVQDCLKSQVLIKALRHESSYSSTLINKLMDNTQHNHQRDISCMDVGSSYNFMIMAFAFVFGSAQEK